MTKGRHMSKLVIGLAAFVLWLRAAPSQAAR